MLHLTLDLEAYDPIKNLDTREKETYIIEQELILKKIFSSLNENNLKISCFVTDEFIKTFYDFFHKYVLKKHEVGCHTTNHIFFKGNNINEFIQAIKINKNNLEKETGLECIGFRAPGGMVPKNLISILKKLNFKYDSSIIPGFVPGRVYHFKAPSVTYFPDFNNILIPNNNNNEIIEFPLLTSKILKLSMNGIFFTFYGNFINLKKYQGIYALVDIHPSDFLKFNIFGKSFIWDKVKSTIPYWKFLDVYIQENKNNDVRLCELYTTQIDLPIHRPKPILEYLPHIHKQKPILEYTQVDRPIPILEGSRNILVHTGNNKINYDDNIKDMKLD